MKYRLKKSSKSKMRKNLIKEDFWVQFHRVHSNQMPMSVGVVEVKIDEKKRN